MLATQTPKLVFPGLAAFYERAAPFGYPLIRIAAGAIIMPHAFPKLFGSFAPVLAKNVLAPLGFLTFPDPLFWAYFLGGLELVGGGLAHSRPADAHRGAGAGDRDGDHHLFRRHPERLVLCEPGRRRRIPRHPHAALSRHPARRARTLRARPAGGEALGHRDPLSKSLDKTALPS
jgi:hypothetical protein